MKKLLTIFCLFFSSLILGANVYFQYPSTGTTVESNSNGIASFNYSIQTVSLWYVADVYRTMLQYPDGTWHVPLNQQTGGWVLNRTGTYRLKGLVHVKYDMGGYSNYWMESNIITIYVNDSYSPSTPQTPIMSSSYGQYGPVRLDWTANTESDLSHYEVWRFFEEEADWRDWELIGTTTSNYFIDNPVTYAPCGGNYHAHYKIKAVDINNNYSNFSLEVTERVEPTWKRLPSNSNNAYITGETTNELPSEFDISNYPNPFNPTTTINYQLPKDGMVTIKVYDLIGKEVTSLVNEQKSAGYNKTDFDASKLTSGVYICSIQACGFNKSIKLLLAK